VTGAQILVLLLLAAAFGAGWVAARDGVGRRARGGSLPDQLRAALVALDRAVQSARVLLDVRYAPGLREGPAPATAAGVLERALAALDGVVEPLLEEVGRANPLAEDLDAAREALRLIAANANGLATGDAAERVLLELDRAALDAQIRFRREAEAVLAVAASTSR
jgi:hypothetical protein